MNIHIKFRSANDVIRYVYSPNVLSKDYERIGKVYGVLANFISESQKVCLIINLWVNLDPCIHIKSNYLVLATANLLPMVAMDLLWYGYRHLPFQQKLGQLQTMYERNRESLPVLIRDNIGRELSELSLARSALLFCYNKMVKLVFMVIVAFALLQRIFTDQSFGLCLTVGLCFLNECFSKPIGLKWQALFEQLRLTEETLCTADFLMAHRVATNSVTSPTSFPSIIELSEVRLTHLLFDKSQHYIGINKRLEAACQMFYASLLDKLGITLALWFVLYQNREESDPSFSNIQTGIMVAFMLASLAIRFYASSFLSDAKRIREELSDRFNREAMTLPRHITLAIFDHRVHNLSLNPRINCSSDAFLPLTIIIPVFTMGFISASYPITGTPMLWCFLAITLFHELNYMRDQPADITQSSVNDRIAAVLFRMNCMFGPRADIEAARESN